MSAHSYFLFFRPLARRAQRQLNVPEEGQDIVHSSSEVRDEILAVVNSAWDTGIAVGMANLPALIAPGSTQYRLDSELLTIRHVKQTPILLIWMKTSQFNLHRKFKLARFAVAFYIPSIEPYHVVDLAYFLLRFQDFFIRDCDYVRFNLVCISYRLEIGGTFGLLLYDQNLASAFAKATLRANQNPAEFKSSQYHHPVSVWPPDSDSSAVRSNANITELLLKVK
ncbi:ATP-dependent DNA helicase [Favolaschia claudopus]